MRKLFFILLFLLATAGTASAQCSGSGTTWSCPAGSTPSQVQTAVNSASNGATITFANGTYTWGSGTIIGLSNSKGVTLICATIGGCNVNSSGTVIGIGQYATGTNANLYRISGFTFNYTGTNFLIWFGYSGDCGTSTAACVMTQVRVDNNTVNASNTSGGMVFLAFADDASVLYTFGVMDHNTLNAPASVQLFLSIAGQNNNPMASGLGNLNNFFLENNAINISNMTNAGLSCVDGWGGSRTVARYNTSNDCLWAQHGVDHGGGSENFEFYNNNIGVDINSVSQGFQDGYRLVHHQGSGTGMYFNNRLTYYQGPASSAGISMLYYRSYALGPSVEGVLWPCDGTQSTFPLVDGNRSPTSSWYGYPCWRQPGRDYFGNYTPLYSWNNIWTNTGAIVPMAFEDLGGNTPPSCTAYNGSNGGTANCDYKTFQLQFNRDDYDAVSASANTSPTSPFNGSTGTGFGLLANRPTSGTASSENVYGMGVAGTGYFATDSGAQGTLYAWTGSTWAIQYTPATYPNPLTGGGGGSPAVSFSPASLNFGTVPVATSFPDCPTNCLTVTETNTGTATLVINLPFSTNSSQFVIYSNGCAEAGGTLSPGANCQIQVSYQPTISGPQSASIVMTDNAPGGSPTRSYPLSGTGGGAVLPQATGLTIASAKAY
jgi:hypothetical protein